MEWMAEWMAWGEVGREGDTVPVGDLEPGSGGYWHPGQPGAGGLQPGARDAEQATSQCSDTRGRPAADAL